MTKMSQVIAAFALVALIFSGVSSIANATPKEVVPSPVNLKGLMGATLTPSDLKNKIVVFQFFASWCVGCDKTMQEMVELTKGRKDVIYVPVSVDEDVKSARSFFTDKSDSVKALETSAFVDTSTEFAARLNVKAVPSVIVADGQGSVVSRSTGHPSKDRLVEFKTALDNAGIKHSSGASH